MSERLVNQQWVLAAYAKGAATEELWTLVEAEIPELVEGQLLVENLWLSVDPYMRGKLNQGAGMLLGEVMGGPGVGRVVQSQHPDWGEGDLIEGPNLGWQRYSVARPDLPGTGSVMRIDPADPEPQAALSWCGMPGYTAYFAMTEIGRPRVGDTVVVSAAGGAVGQIAGQIAHMAGARVVAIAGSNDKLAWCQEIGFDGVINYRTAQNLGAEILRACPDGVDVFFDGTGGEVHDAVLQHLAPRARVAVVGKVAVASEGLADHGTRSSAKLIETRATVQGFTVYDWWERRPEAAARLKSWRADGRLQFREDVVRGLENVPASFLRMMRGENFGKQLVKL